MYIIYLYNLMRFEILNVFNNPSQICEKDSPTVDKEQLYRNINNTTIQGPQIRRD